MARFWLAVGLLLATALVLALLSAAWPVAADATTTVRGYVLSGKYPTTKQCRAYERRHSGVERWRLWVRRYAYRQARMAGKGAWRYVWNEDWVLRVIPRESGGNQGQVTGAHYGLLQIRWDHAPGRNLRVGWINIAVGSQLFARSGPQPWACTMQVGVTPYARRR